MPALQVKYIFLLKNSTQNESDKKISALSIKQMFNMLFKNVTKNSFDIEIDNATHKVEYKISNLQNANTYYLNIMMNGTRIQCAKVLDVINKTLTRGVHRKDYNIILSFDGVSLHYCNKIYPKFNIFERKIRELIFEILVKSFGVNWYDSTISSELKADMEKQTKGMKQSELIEKALYEMTIFQLETYLFSPYREVDVFNVIDNELNPKEISRKTKEDIVSIIEKCRAKCLWERFFEGKIKIEGLDTNLETIRSYRNNVAHSKYFYKEDYDNCNRILVKLLRQIERAINNIESRTFSDENIGESISVFFEALLLSYRGEITSQLKKIAEAMAITTKINISKIKFEFPQLDYGLSDKMNRFLTPTVIDTHKLVSLNTKLGQILGKSNTKYEHEKLLSENLGYFEDKLHNKDIK